MTLAEARYGLSSVAFEAPTVEIVDTRDNEFYLLISFKHSSDIGGNPSCQGQVDLWAEPEWFGDNPPRDDAGRLMTTISGFCFGCEREVGVSRIALKPEVTDAWTRLKEAELQLEG